MGVPTIMTRGTTIDFLTNFYDAQGAITQPDAAKVVVVYPLPGGVTGTAEIDMDPPTSSESRWSAQWDSRGAAPGVVFWSVHTVNLLMPPAAVDDGQFTLRANAANPLTF